MPRLHTRNSDRPSLRAEVRAAADIAFATKDEMYALFARAYEATDRQRFLADLDAKRDALLLRDGAGRVAGFTTLAVFEESDGARPIRFVFSGETLVDPAHWGSNALTFAWIRHLAAIKAEAPATSLYWLLISKGFRTYRYLSTFAQHYVPMRAGPDDPALAALRDRLAARLFGRAFDVGRGIVAHDPPRERLAPALANLPQTGHAVAEARFSRRATRGTGAVRSSCACARWSPTTCGPLPGDTTTRPWHDRRLARHPRGVGGDIPRHRDRPRRPRRRPARPARSDPVGQRRDPFRARTRVRPDRQS